jgi:hypothetical protein
VCRRARVGVGRFVFEAPLPNPDSRSAAEIAPADSTDCPIVDDGDRRGGEIQARKSRLIEMVLVGGREEHGAEIVIELAAAEQFVTFDLRPGRRDGDDGEPVTGLQVLEDDRNL